MKRSGFTLIELLVVIAVIAMLIGILVPALRAARQQAKAVACGSNLKQLSLALTAYEQENGIFPCGFDNYKIQSRPLPSGGYPGTAARDIQGWWWFHLLDIPGEYFGKGTILWCPSRTVKDHNVLCGNYGVNRAICKDYPNPETGNLNGEFVGKSLGLNQIGHASKTLLIADSGYSLISWRGVTNAPIQPFENPARVGAFYLPGLGINKERIILPSCERDAINGRHPSKTVNVGFTDGHVSRVKADDLFVEEIDGKYSNLFPLWLPK